MLCLEEIQEGPDREDDILSRPWMVGKLEVEERILWEWGIV